MKQLGFAIAMTTLCWTGCDKATNPPDTGIEVSHYDDPIIIDNGPAEVSLLPATGHDSYLLDGRDDGHSWKVVDKARPEKLKIIVRQGGQTDESTSAISSPKVTVYFDHRGKGKPAGHMEIDWTSFGSTGIVDLKSWDNGDTKLHWDQYRKPRVFLGLNGKGGADYRITKVVYQRAGVETTWPPIGTTLSQGADIDVIICPGQSRDLPCQFTPR